MDAKGHVVFVRYGTPLTCFNSVHKTKVNDRPPTRTGPGPGAALDPPVAIFR